MRSDDIEYLRSDERFLNMTMGEPYVGKYQFLDIQQGEREIGKLEGQRRRLAEQKKEYEEELEEAEEIEGNTQRQYEELEAQLKVKEEILADVKQDADRLRRGYAGCRRQIRMYVDAIQRARQGLEVVQEIARRRARGNKRSDDEIGAVDPRSGDQDIVSRNSPSVAPKSDVPPRRAPTRISPEAVQEALRRQAAGDQEREYRRYAREEPRQHQKYPAGCTLAVDGVPHEMTEGAFCPSS